MEFHVLFENGAICELAREDVELALRLEVFVLPRGCLEYRA